MSAMQLLCPDWVLTMTGEPTALRNTAVLIQDDTIIDIGESQQLKRLHTSATVVDLPNQVLMPGLINMHTHSAMTLLRAAADDMALHDWLQNRIWPLEGALMDESFVYDGTVLAVAEMLKGGTTTFNDMYFYPEETVRAALDLGARVSAGIVAIEFPTNYGDGPDNYITKGLTALKTFAGEPTVSWTVAPHAPYTVGDQTFLKLRDLSDSLSIPIHCHLHETASEVSDAVSRDGMRPFERLNKLGLINDRFLAVHGVHLNDEELATMADKGTHLVHCPASNLKLASGFAPTARALSAGVNVVIGTDGAASNNQLDMWAEGRMASLLAKGTSADATAWPAYQLLESMTCKAAQALGRGDDLGQIKKNFKADLITVEVGTSKGLSPINQLSSLLAYSGKGAAVSNVWVNGRRVVHTQQLSSKGEQITDDCLLKCTNLWQTRIQQVG